MKHYYYLHTNGSLIHKVSEPNPSDFVVKIWALNIKNREQAWILCTEALALGANKERIKELAEHWGLTDEDAQEYIKVINAAVEKKDNIKLEKDGNAWCATWGDHIDLQQSHAGFGDTCLEALSELIKGGTVCSNGGRVCD